MRRLAIVCAAVMLPAAGITQEAAPTERAPASPLLAVLGDELRYSMANLVTEEGIKPYYLAYTITGERTLSVGAELGALTRDANDHRRMLDCDVRVGSYEVDNTHKLRGNSGFDFSMFFSPGAASISLEDEPAAIGHGLWLITDRAFKAAVKKHQRVLTNLKTKVQEETAAHDFSREEPNHCVEPEVRLDVDVEVWRQRVRRVSQLARRYPQIYDSSVSLTASAENRCMVTSEGTRLQTGRVLMRVVVSAGTKADDGMELGQSFIFNAVDADALPTETQVLEAFQKVIDTVLALRAAPLVEPYSGPAILMNRASAVFFHEIFGHRIEGHRQKDVEEGQTFAKKIGEEVLPAFLDVTDDPTLESFEQEELRGFYRYDEEGVPAARVALIEDGVLRNFLLSRSPLENFPKSNGHGRRQPGRPVVARQGNLLVTSRHTVPMAALRKRLIEECKRQSKPYGLLFEDITGGFTTTMRGGPQAFKVLPVVVYRVYADGRPDELVRGVDIVGTPLACFSEILCTGDDPAVFNGTCGAESGMVPVSAISPSILVGKIEIEKRERDQEKLPILPAPIAEEAKAVESGARKKEGK